MIEIGVESDQDRARAVRGVGGGDALSLSRHRSEHADRRLQLVIEHGDELDRVGALGAAFLLQPAVGAGGADDRGGGRHGENP